MGRKMHIGSCIVMLAWASMALGEAIWFVDAAGGGDLSSIQAAIDVAGSGDEILVTPGTYPEAIDFLGKAIRLYGTAGPESTTIDGTGHSHVVQCISGEGADTILEGFTITGGDAAESYEPDGGLWSRESRPTVTRCIFVGNSARYGGGISGDATVTDCTFRSNVAYTGGGTWRTGTIVRCAFIGNAASTGGAISGAQMVSGCTFIDNEEGVWDVDAVTGCTFAGAFGNTGLTNAATVTNCTFTGSGIVARGDLRSLVTNCTFINTGGIFTALGGRRYADQLHRLGQSRRGGLRARGRDLQRHRGRLAGPEQYQQRSAVCRCGWPSVCQVALHRCRHEHPAGRPAVDGYRGQSAPARR